MSKLLNTNSKVSKTSLTPSSISPHHTLQPINNPKLKTYPLHQAFIYNLIFKSGSNWHLLWKTITSLQRVSKRHQIFLFHCPMPPHFLSTHFSKSWKFLTDLHLRNIYFIIESSFYCDLDPIPATLLTIHFHKLANYPQYSQPLSSTGTFTSLLGSSIIWSLLTKEHLTKTK